MEVNEFKHIEKVIVEKWFESSECSHDFPWGIFPRTNKGYFIRLWSLTLEKVHF